jgi:HrpA-like RNA helicase
MLEKGQSLPERCEQHREQHRKETKKIKCPYFQVEPAFDISAFDYYKAAYTPHGERPKVKKDATPDSSGMRIRITDKHVLKLYEALRSNQVVVVSSPTGTGKSIYLLYRLLEQAPGCSDDFVGNLIRQGQIIQTQPLRGTVRRNPEAVSRNLLGESAPGRLMTLGLYHRGHEDYSPYNLGVVVTDGAVRNWIRKGQLGQYSVIFVDEAHKRTVNIDILLLMLKHKLPQHPHLRVIISSATIDPNEFKTTFESEGIRVAVLDLSKTLGEELNYQEHYWNGGAVEGCDCWFCFSDEARARLRQSQEPPTLSAMPKAVANFVLEILQHTEHGSILAFLPGEAAIKDAMRLVEEGRQKLDISQHVRVVPLYRRLGTVERDLSEDGSRRVLLSTDITETGLTIPDLVYGIDSGYIKETQWDGDTLSRSLLAVAHSQAGRKQRWGRFGRTGEKGYVYCLYTEADFHNPEKTPPQTVPEILRSPLEDAVLTLRAAGIPHSQIMGAPTEDQTVAFQKEDHRSFTALEQEGLIDNAGVITEKAVEVFHISVSAMEMALLTLADEHNCLLEMATVLSLMSTEEGSPRTGEGLYDHEGLLVWNPRWNTSTKDWVWRLHQSLKAGCRDDLDFVGKIAFLYLRAQERGKEKQWAEYQFVNELVIRRAIVRRDERLAKFATRMQLGSTFPSDTTGHAETRGRPIRLVDMDLIQRVRAVINAALPSKVVTLVHGDPMRYNPGTTASLATPCVISGQCVGDWSKEEKAILLSAGKASVLVEGRPTVASVASFLVRAMHLTDSKRGLCILADQIFPVGSVVDMRHENKKCRLVGIRELPGRFTPEFRQSCEKGNTTDDDNTTSRSFERDFLIEDPTVELQGRIM